MGNLPVSSPSFSMTTTGKTYQYSDSGWWRGPPKSGTTHHPRGSQQLWHSGKSSLCLDRILFHQVPAKNSLLRPPHRWGRGHATGEPGQSLHDSVAGSTFTEEVLTATASACQPKAVGVEVVRVWNHICTAIISKSHITLQSLSLCNNPTQKLKVS